MDGLFRISAGNTLWVDAVIDSQIVESAAFEMQSNCERIRKSVAYHFKAGKTVILQLNGNPDETVGPLISRLKPAGFSALNSIPEKILLFENRNEQVKYAFITAFTARYRSF